jgi:hypothetical protein
MLKRQAGWSSVSAEPQNTPGSSAVFDKLLNAKLAGHRPPGIGAILWRRGRSPQARKNHKRAKKAPGKAASQGGRGRQSFPGAIGRRATGFRAPRCRGRPRQANDCEAKEASRVGILAGGQSLRGPQGPRDTERPLCRPIRADCIPCLLGEFGPESAARNLDEAGRICELHLAVKAAFAEIRGISSGRTTRRNTRPGRGLRRSPWGTIDGVRARGRRGLVPTVEPRPIVGPHSISRPG